MKASIVLCAAALLLFVAAPALAHPGACCIPDGTCEDVDVSGQCDWAGGTFIESASCTGGDVCASVCRFTGGGNDTFTQEWDGTMGEGSCTGNNRSDFYTFGGQAGAPSAGPMPFGEWTHRQHKGPSGKWTFHAGTSSAGEGTMITSIECSDPGFCNPARHAPAHQLDFTGIGEFENVKQAPDSFDGFVEAHVSRHCFEVHIEDAGEPGSAENDPAADCPESGHVGGMVDCGCADYYHITIHASTTCDNPIYDVSGYITGGNFQIHPPVGGL